MGSAGERVLPRLAWKHLSMHLLFCFVCGFLLVAGVAWFFKY
jgi:hypothetical protein